MSDIEMAFDALEVFAETAIFSRRLKFEQSILRQSTVNVQYPGGPVETQVAWPWALVALRHRLPEMILRAIKDACDE